MFLKNVKMLFSFIILVSAQCAFATSFLESSVTYLASDALEGRKPGTQGNELAKKYIESELKKSGLSPLGKSYYQDFTIFTEMIKRGDNFLKLEGGGAESAFQPLSYSQSATITNQELIFAGFGITIPKSDSKLIYDDYKGLDVKGRVVVIMSGDPAIGNAASIFRQAEYLNYQTLFYKIKNAINHGASGVLVLTNPLSLENYPNESDPYFNATDGGGKRFEAVSGLITNKWLNKILASNSLSTLKVQQIISKTQKPYSFSVGKKVSLSVSLKKNTGRVSNIVGVLPGTDETLSKEVVVIGAHFDHLGHGGDSSMDHSQIGQIHNGADDNASGTAMVLQLAKDLSGKKLKRTYMFVLFNAEEVGLLGSSHFVSMWARHAEKYGKLFAMLNFDMIGRFRKEVSVMGTGTSLNWKPVLSNLTAKIPFSVTKDALGSSDHASFTDKNIPSLFFTTGAHDDYHRASDTSDKIRLDAMEHIRTYAFKLIKKMELQPSLIFNTEYNTSKPGGQNRGYGAHLGCVPQFGQSDDIKGVVCMRASANSPAQKAGIIAGDVLIQIGDIDIKSIYDLAFALKYYRAGDKVNIAWIRENKKHVVEITLAKSKR